MKDYAAATSENTIATLENFFQKTSSQEIADELLHLNEVFIVHAPVDRLSLANTTSFVNKLSRFVNQLENMVKERKGTSVPVLSLINEGPY